MPNGHRPLSSTSAACPPDPAEGLSPGLRPVELDSLTGPITSHRDGHARTHGPVLATGLAHRSAGPAAVADSQRGAVALCTAQNVSSVDGRPTVGTHPWRADRRIGVRSLGPRLSLSVTPFTPSWLTMMACGGCNALTCGFSAIGEPICALIGGVPRHHEHAGREC